MKQYINSHNIKAILFDVDGTFYPVSFYISVYYQFLITAMRHYFDYDEEKAVAELDAYGIYPYFDPKAKSGTDYMINHGITVTKWNRYRDLYYRLDDFSHTETVKAQTLQALSLQYDLFIISNNTPAVIADTLSQMAIDPEWFKRIYTSVDLIKDGQKCSKDYVYRQIHDTYHYDYGQMLAVGDRYPVDLAPLIHLGGNGLQVDHPDDIDCLLTL